MQCTMHRQGNYASIIEDGLCCKILIWFGRPHAWKMFNWGLSTHADLGKEATLLLECLHALPAAWMLARVAS